MGGGPPFRLTLEADPAHRGHHFNLSFLRNKRGGLAGTEESHKAAPRAEPGHVRTSPLQGLNKCSVRTSPLQGPGEDKPSAGALRRTKCR